MDTGFFECRKDSLGLESLATDLLDKAKELKLCDIRTTLSNDDIKGLHVVVFYWLEYNQVKRLKIVSRMRW